jgi:hypothetical protein
MTLFDFLNEITYQKSDWESFSEEDKKAWNSFMINRFLSMNPDYIEFVNIIQKYQYLTDKQVYTLYKHLIPKRKIFLKYIKGKKDKVDKNDLEYLAEYFECSTREVKDYIELTPKKELSNILDNFKTTTSKDKIK